MYERRLLRLFFTLAALLVVVLGRAFWVQVVAAERIVRTGASALRTTTVVHPRRGEILWRDGTPAVRNATRCVVRIDVPAFDADRVRCAACGGVTARRQEPRPCADCGATRWTPVAKPDAGALAAVLGVPRDELERRLVAARALHARTRWGAVDLLGDHRLSREAAVVLASRAAEFPGLDVRAEPTREADAEIAVLAGRAHLAQAEDLAALCDPERAAAGLHVYSRAEALRTLVGHSGLELRHDERFRGTPGILERAAVRRGEPAPAPTVVRDVVDGAPLRTTLSRDVQRVAMEVVGAAPADVATAVVLDARDGAIVAMAWKSRDAYCRPITALVPGSVFKLVPALALLEQGLDPHATLDCAGAGFLRPGVRYKCTGVHPGADLWSAFGSSCNHYFMRRSEDVGAVAMADAYERLGLSAQLRLGIGVAPQASLTRDFGRFTAQLGIGQAQALASPLQVATAYARLASGGRRVTPWFDLDAGPAPESLEVDPVIARWAPTLLEAARRTVTDGTARSVAALRAMDAAGKSGTAQIPLGGGRETNNAWFVAFAPAGAPRYVALVVHERVDAHGATGAGPAVAQLLEAALR